MSKLFDDFDEVSAKQWKQKIQFDLKGAVYNETLVWQSLEGIHVKPFYHQDDVANPFPPIPGQPQQWNIAQSIFIDDPKIANRLALDAVERGAEAILFSSEAAFDTTSVFKDFPFDRASIYFDLQFLSEAFMLQLQQYLTEKQATVYYNIDLIGHLAEQGNWYHSLEKDHSVVETVVQKASEANILSVDTTTYQNAGANIVQQLAYAMAHANEYLNHWSANEDTTQAAGINSMTFKIAVGSNYFFEIAKIRALRKLYAVLAGAYHCKRECHVVAIPSKRNKAIYDYNVNMLRTTTECMSAILGGADTICNLPYDVLYHKSNEFGERIARNQLLILKAESYFDTVSNPADGTYYIENLTTELAEKALELFKNIEAGGGFLKQLKEGTIQRKIKESAEKEQQLFDSGKLKLLGTNYQTNAADRMKDDMELYPFVKTKARKTLIAPVVPRRLSVKIEQERLKTEQS